MQKRRGLATLGIVALICTGCGDGRPKIVPVSGQVLIDGKPLTFGYVRFAAKGNRPSMGRIDENGRFTLTCFQPNDGAVVGEHRVAIMSQEPISGGDQIKWHAPRKYASYATSGITQQITGPTDSLSIHLTSDGEAPPKPK